MSGVRDATPLYPIAEQASRILAYLSRARSALAQPDSVIAAQVGLVSAQQVSTVRAVLILDGLATTNGVESQLAVSGDLLAVMAHELRGAAKYIEQHLDRNEVSLVLTEPGRSSLLRSALDEQADLPPAVFETMDAFVALAHSATRELTIVTPFLDERGAAFLLTLSMSSRKLSRRAG